MQLYRNGSGPTNRAPESTFTGEVFISGYFQREAPSRLAGAVATSTPGSRTPWKANPLGQTLIVTSGVGWAQGQSEQIVEICAGDVVWCPPGQRRWEGATPDQAMIYVAIHEKTVELGRVEPARKTGRSYRPHPTSKPILDMRKSTVGSLRCYGHCQQVLCGTDLAGVEVRRCAP